MAVVCNVDSETGDMTLENERVRLTFKKTKTGYAEFLIYVFNGSEWFEIGVGRPLGHFSYRSNGRMNYSRNISPSTYEVKKEEEATTVVFSSKEIDVDGAEWNFQFEFGLKPDEKRIFTKHTAITSKERRLLHFNGPNIYVGEGSFGATKDLAVFPGLEYLLSGERSSSTIEVYETVAHRFLPHPYKVTIPLMFVAYKGYVLGLAWNPLHMWDGKNAYMSAKFASPNWIEPLRQNHLIGLFIPSVPKWVNENGGVQDPYQMKANHQVSIEAWIVADHTEEPLRVFNQWFEIYGTPDLPKPPMKPEEAIEVSAQTYLNRFDHENCTFSQNVPESWGPHASPLTSLHLWIHSLSVEDQQYKSRLREVANKAMNKFLSTSDIYIPYANGTGYRWWCETGSRFLLLDLFLYAGSIEKSLKAVRDYARIFMANQRPDGSFGFMPNEGYKVLGQTGDTALGLCSFPAYYLLKYARYTGDQTSLQAGLKALRFMNTLKKPEGGQTWECPLHNPDIVPAAQAILANLEAYKITGDDEYLSKAVFWAYTGLPFIYMWGALDRLIMKYGSIPVWTSFYIGTWFGRIVQWCGLEYAYSLRLLSDYDKSLPWRTIADGITICGMQQQAEGISMCEKSVIPEDYRGYYPDSYSVVDDDFSSYWLAPSNGPETPGGNLLSNYLGLEDKNVETSFSVLNMGKKKVHINSAALIKEPKYNAEKKELTFELEYPVNEACFSMIAGISKPEKVTKNGVEIQTTANIDVADEGWKYLDNQSLLLIKAKPTSLKIKLI